MSRAVKVLKFFGFDNSIEFSDYIVVHDEY